MTDLIEERAAIMEHDAGWPRAVAESMAKAWSTVELPGRFDADAMRIRFARDAFELIASLADIARLDPELHGLFLEQCQEWDTTRQDDPERADIAGGMVRGYVALIECFMRHLCQERQRGQAADELVLRR